MNREELRTFLKDNLKISLSIKDDRYRNQSNVRVELYILDENGDKDVLDWAVEDIDYDTFEFTDREHDR